MTQYFPPGSKLGVLGSGQLGRMFAIAARRLGYGVHVFSPDENSPTAQVADREFVAEYDDLNAIEEFAQSVSVITFEFENVPAASTDVAQKFTRVDPCVEILHLSQNRNREKSSLAAMGIPVPKFEPVHSLDDLKQAVQKLGRPSVLKTATMGYDGKGQTLIQPDTDLETLWPEYEGQESILEQFVDFEMEISVVGARGREGDFAACGPIQNDHRNHILDVSVLPAMVSDAIAKQAIEVTRTVMSEIDVVGVLCIEFFVTSDGRLLVNELAPRPHNSGHLTIDACETCQFEQQVRAIAGLPLGQFNHHQPAAMVNLLGDEWEQGEPDWVEFTRQFPDVKIHLYGKEEPRPGRKMGHLTCLAETGSVAAERVLQARELLTARYR
ncbi:N5-carboxyaminoimidazole ribonucleotide synthase [Polystyrenella longa]|uniref:N5-carboxyaminoimidazole ribonucleotide synthase n=1 Tax=Polystyrenella longa TaxID=2528007 RepID=A0A518CSI3_9PLAN|nr:5-(carboxyamino)imidazole ribonucleotide synthase [Polystyrenella longa]QDU82176.1 N5-carboxyaminoimidazole ribonucleotide synthase [Polystyrenella longa]